MLEQLRRELRYATRRLRRAKGFAFVVVGILAAALVSSATLLSVLDALVLRRLPVHQPDRLVAVSRESATGQVRWMSAALFQEISRQQRSFSAISGYAGGVLLTVEAEGLLQSTTAELVTGNYYATLGVAPAAERLISDVDRPLSADPARVATIDYEIWQRYFGGDPAVVGRSIKVAGVALTIVGVTPRRFTGLQVDVAPGVSVPIGLLGALTGMTSPDALPQINYVVARLAPHSTVAAAEAQLAAVWPAVRTAAAPRTLDAGELDQFNAMRLRVTSLDRGFSPSRTRYADPLRVLAAATGLLLLLACLNITALFLARGLARRHECTVLSALGASRGQIARSIIMESLPLTLAAGLVAVPCVWIATRLVADSLWTGLVPLSLRVAPDGWLLATLLAFTIGLGAAIGAGVAHVASPQHVGTGRSHAMPSSRWRGPLVVAQVAVSLILVFTATLLGRSAVNVASVEPGVDRDRALVAKLAKRPGGPTASMDISRYLPHLLEKLGSLPSVEKVAVSHLFPYVANDAALMRPVRVVRRGAPADTTSIIDIVSPDFFRAAGITTVSGRAFDWSDDGGSVPVAVVNQSAARRLIGPGPALGERLSLGKGPRRESVEIVGVVADATMGNLRSSGVPVVFRPSLQEPAYLEEPTLTIRTAGDPRLAATAVRETVAALGYHYVLALQTLDARIDAGIARERIMGVLSTCFAIIAVAVAIGGLYGALAYSVSRRTHEIGIRMALGASSASVVQTVMREGFLLILAGLALGLPLALIAGRSIEALLFGVSHSDRLSLVAALLLFVGVGLVAGLGPARRASRVDPIVALSDARGSL